MSLYTPRTSFFTFSQEGESLFAPVIRSHSSDDNRHSAQSTGVAAFSCKDTNSVCVVIDIKLAVLYYQHNTFYTISIT